MTKDELLKIFDLATMQHTDYGYETLRSKVQEIAREALAEHAMQEVQRLGQEIEQEPCDMGEVCLGCSPRSADGSCPDAKPSGACDCYKEGFRDGMNEFKECYEEQPPKPEQEPLADALHFAHWTTDKKDLSDYILVGSLTLAGIEDGEYGTSEIDPLDNTIDALQERLVTGSDHKKVPLLAYIGALKPTPPQPERHELQTKGEHPAPCARHCEANAFQIVIKNLKAQLAQPEQECNCSQGQLCRVCDPDVANGFEQPEQEPVNKNGSP